MTSREIAQKVGISNGSAHYLLISLIYKEYIKILSFKENSQKVKDFYLLTPNGICEKSLFNTKFLIRKNRNLKRLKKK